MAKTLVLTMIVVAIKEKFADFYALMPPDNSATVTPGTDVSFPQDDPNSGAAITRTGPRLI